MKLSEIQNILDATALTGEEQFDRNVVGAGGVEDRLRRGVIGDSVALVPGRHLAEIEGGGAPAPAAQPEPAQPQQRPAGGTMWQ